MNTFTVSQERSRTSNPRFRGSIALWLLWSLPEKTKLPERCFLFRCERQHTECLQMTSAPPFIHVSAPSCSQPYVGEFTRSFCHAGRTGFKEYKLMTCRDWKQVVRERTGKSFSIPEKFETITCPSVLIGHDKGLALGMALTHVNSFFDAKDRQHASIVLIGRPAAVVLSCYWGIWNAFVLCQERDVFLRRWICIKYHTTFIKRNAHNMKLNLTLCNQLHHC